MTNLESAANAVLANAKEIAGFADFVMVRRDLIGALRSAIEPEADARDAARYRWLRDDNAYAPEEEMVRGGERLDKLCDEGIAQNREMKALKPTDDLLRHLAESGDLEARSDTYWIYGEKVHVDHDSDPKSKAVRERYGEVADKIRAAGYEIDLEHSDSDHDSLWITFRPAVNRGGERGD